MQPLNIQEPSRQSLRLIFEAAMTGAKLSASKSVIEGVANWYELQWLLQDQKEVPDGEEKADAGEGGSE